MKGQSGIYCHILQVFSNIFLHFGSHSAIMSLLTTKGLFFEMKKFLRDGAFIILGTLLNAIGIYFFKMPNHFTTGGVSGVSMLLNGLFGVDTTITMTIINIALLLIGFVFLGKGCGAKIVIGTLLYSGFTLVFEFIYPAASLPFTDNALLELMFAIMLPAIGTAMLFNVDSSTGGTDIIAMIIKKYTGADSGTALLFADAVIAVMGFFVFDIEAGLLSVLGLGLRSVVVDSVIESINLCKYFTIVTTKPDEISERLFATMDHSVTVLDARGAYSGAEKTVLLIVCRRSEAMQLKKLVKDVDKGAFMMITNSSEIIGKGFRGA